MKKWTTFKYWLKFGLPDVQIKGNVGIPTAVHIFKCPVPLPAQALVGVLALTP